MTARNYLIQQLSDPEPSYSDHKTKIALAAYAIRIYQQKEGYSLEDAEQIILSCVNDNEFVEKCSNYISNITEFEGFVFPKYIDD